MWKCKLFSRKFWCGMATIEKTLRIESDTQIQFDDPSRISFEQALTEFSIKLPVKAFHFERVQEKFYKYSFDFIDGRHWEQNVTLDNPNDELIDFDSIHGLWRANSEAVLHRPVRSSVAAFVAATKYSIRKIEFKIVFS